MRHIVDEFVTVFGFDVDERTLSRGRQVVDRFVGRLEHGTRAANGMELGIRNMVLGWVGLQSVLGGGRWLVDTNVELENLEAALVVTTGSTEAAAAAMERVQDFAQRSPDTLNEVTRAYQTLVGLGIDPLEERLTRLGDTAAAVQTPLDLLVDAAARASSGETEVLRNMFARFGIRFVSRNRVLFAQVGDELVEIGDQAEDVLGYLEQLGAGAFAGAMERRANTLSGRFSMLGDAATKFAGAVGKNGLNDGLKELANLLTEMTGRATGTAVALGRILGGALRYTSIGLEFANNHARTLAVGLALIGGTAVVSRIMSAVAAIRMVGTAALVAQAKALLIPAAITAIIVLVALLIDDLRAFMNGQDSLIGRLLERYPELQQTIEDIGGALREMGADGRWAWNELVSAAERGVNALRGVFGDFSAWWNQWVNTLDIPEPMQQMLQLANDIRGSVPALRPFPMMAAEGLGELSDRVNMGRRGGVDLGGGQVFVPESPGALRAGDVDRLPGTGGMQTARRATPGVQVNIERIETRPDASPREVGQTVGRVAGEEIDRQTRRRASRMVP